MSGGGFEEVGLVQGGAGPDEPGVDSANAAGLAAQIRSARLVTQVRTTRAWMQTWQGTRAVSVRDDQLAACGRASGTVD